MTLLTHVPWLIHERLLVRHERLLVRDERLLVRGERHFGRRQRRWTKSIGLISNAGLMISRRRAKNDLVNILLTCIFWYKRIICTNMYCSFVVYYYG